MVAMKTWQMVWIYYYPWMDEIQFRSTDPQAEALIVEAAREQVPECGYTHNPATREGGRIHHLNKRGYEVQWHILTALGQAGWEPFAVDQSVYFLRKGGSPHPDPLPKGEGER
jgi:hypothetical protein